MATINEIQDEIIEEFADFDDWMDKYQLLIDLGGEQEPLPEQYKTESNLIDGCQSRVWLQADYEAPPQPSPGREKVVLFRAESDALIVKGIVALLIRVSAVTPHRKSSMPTSTSSMKSASVSTCRPPAPTVSWLW